jgi:hypothetical protein
MREAKMALDGKQIERLISELSFIEFENSRLLDDGSLRLIAQVRSRDLLTDDEWVKIKTFLKEALNFLSASETTVKHDDDPRVILDPDADPRNADWIKISAACRLAQRALPIWAALWLWWLRTDTSPPFWREVGRIAKRLGYPELLAKDAP